MDAQDVFIHNLTAERDRLRAALEKLIAVSYFAELDKRFPLVLESAQEALKGQS